MRDLNQPKIIIFNFLLKTQSQNYLYIFVVGFWIKSKVKYTSFQVIFNHSIIIRFEDTQTNLIGYISVYIYFMYYLYIKNNY